MYLTAATSAFSAGARALGSLALFCLECVGVHAHGASGRGTFKPDHRHHIRPPPPPPLPCPSPPPLPPALQPASSTGISRPTSSLTTPTFGVSCFTTPTLGAPGLYVSLRVTTGFTPAISGLGCLAAGQAQAEAARVT